MIFRTQENVPHIYPNKSRDFQLLCRVKDYSLGATRQLIDTIPAISTTSEISDRLLPLLANKLGLFNIKNIDNRTLRHLCLTFPFIIKWKGSKRAIEMAVNAWLQLYIGITEQLNPITIDTEKNLILIHMSNTSVSTAYLDVIFEYILPQSYSYAINQAIPQSLDPISIEADTDTYRAILIDSTENSKLDTTQTAGFPDRVKSKVGLTTLYIDHEDHSVGCTEQIFPKNDGGQS